MAESEGKFRTLDDIFSIENLGVPENDYTPAMEPHRLIELNGFKDQLAHLCDVQGRPSNRLLVHICIWIIPKLCV